MSRGLDATAFPVTPVGPPSWEVLVKLIHNLDQEHFPGYPVVISLGRMKGGTCSHTGLQGVRSLAAEGKAQSSAVALGPAWNLQAHQQPLINDPLHEAMYTDLGPGLQNTPEPLDIGCSCPECLESGGSGGH